MDDEKRRGTETMVRAGLVPYIAAWSGERPVRAPVVAKGRWGIGYQRERPGDRDAHGVLWSRYLRAPNDGVPDFGKVHPHRQRQAMRRLLCQVCGGPADQNEQGVLWLIDDTSHEWSGKEMTPNPPICLPCAGSARRVCPHLRRKGVLALRARHAPIVGVSGRLYALSRRGPTPLGRATLTYDDPQVRLLQAHHLLRELRDCTAVDLDQETSRLRRRSRELMSEQVSE
jgi:hypothetical protein